MQILVGYATSEGQTRKIARYAADHMAAHGHTVELLSLEDSEGLELDRFDAVLLAGSVHAGGFQRELREFVKARSPELALRHDLFLSVSLTAAGDDPEDWDGLRKIIAAFTKDCGWSPDRIEHVAGAFRFTEYNLLEKFMMRRIAAVADPTVDTSINTEYTDWARLADVLEDWTAALAKV